MIEKYLEENTYNFVIHGEFNKNGLRHVVITEYSPCGSKNMFILHEDDNNIYNEDNDVVYNKDKGCII